MSIKITKHDRVFRQILLRLQDYTCQRCGTKYDPEKCAGLHTSHFYTRSKWSVRCDFENADLHCYGCHSYFEGHPHEFSEWKRNQLGPDKYKALVERANAPKKWKKGEKEQMYREMKDRLKKMEQSDGLQ